MDVAQAFECVASELSSSETGHWKVAQTREQLCLRCTTARKANQMIIERQLLGCNWKGMARSLPRILLAALTLTASAAKTPAGFTEKFADVNGVRRHYLIGGTGSAVVLLHGYAQTSHMWNPILPLLAEKHTVIIPDLRGAGGSSKSEFGYDKKNMAV